METRAPAVELDRVGKRYGASAATVHALREVTLAIDHGELVSIVGPSGSGKSTLLNLMAGLDTPSEGRVLVGGRELAGLSDDERSDLRLERIGFVFQTFNLFPSFTVEENVLWPLRFRRVPWGAARERAAAQLAQVEIAPSALRRRPAELSGGEQQRVAIARALVTDPALLLADEPTGNLDSRTGQSILDLILKLNRTRRVTVILVTHSALAAAYGRRTVELCDGRVVRDVQAPPEEGRLLPLGR
jgi:putative ABC transport system ATP-binding protein